MKVSLKIKVALKLNLKINQNYLIISTGKWFHLGFRVFSATYNFVIDLADIVWLGDELLCISWNWLWTMSYWKMLNWRLFRLWIVVVIKFLVFNCLSLFHNLILVFARHILIFIRLSFVFIRIRFTLLIWLWWGLGDWYNFCKIPNVKVVLVIFSLLHLYWFILLLRLLIALSRFLVLRWFSILVIWFLGKFFRRTRSRKMWNAAVMAISFNRLAICRFTEIRLGLSVVEAVQVGLLVPV